MEGPLEKSKKAGKKMILDLVSPNNLFPDLFSYGLGFRHGTNEVSSTWLRTDPCFAKKKAPRTEKVRSAR